MTLVAEPSMAPGRSDALGVRPYGLVGVSVSLVVLFAASLILCALALALAFGVAVLVLGWPSAVDRISGLQKAAASDESLIQRVGILFSLLLYAAISVCVLAAARVRGGARWRELVAWRPWNPFRGAGLYWAIVVVTVIYSFGANALLSRFYPPSNDWVTLPEGRVWASLFVILAVLFAPVTEELLFRGWLYTALRETIGIWIGILVTSVLFALAHWENTHLYALAVFPVGLALGIIRQKTGSLRASMLFHALYNGVGSIVLIYAS